jgi:hypothetical protein
MRFALVVALVCAAAAVSVSCMVLRSSALKGFD